MIGRALALLLALALAGAARAEPAFDDSQRAQILSHGPWPMAVAPDASNRLIGNPAAIALGQALFHDPGLSPDGAFACAICHDPAQGWADGVALRVARRPLVRNAPGLLNVAAWRWFGWDGGHDTLWGQSLRPLLDPAEMGGSLGHVAARVRTDPDLACRWRAALGAPPGVDDERVAVDAAKALAAFQATLVSGRTPFDDFRDALARGDDAAAATYPAAARRGLTLFLGEGRCGACHVGPLFSNREFHDIGLPYFVAGGGVDPGRHGGIRKLADGRWGLGGPFDDSAGASDRRATRHVDLQPRNFGEFRVPSLRQLGSTAPYAHDGSKPDLRAMIRHYSELDPERLHAEGEALLRPLHLTEAEIDDLLAFLATLDAPVPALPPLPPCPG